MAFRNCLVVVLLAFYLLATDAVGAEFRPTAQQRIVPAGAALELVWDKGTFTEGPADAGDGTMLFSDIGNRIMRFAHRTQRAEVYREPSGKANGLFFDRQGRLVACEGAGGGNRRVSLTGPDGKPQTLVDSYQGKRLNSPNDLVIDESDRIFFTDPRYGSSEGRELDFEGVFAVVEGQLVLATRDVQRPNGIVISRDGKTAYVADNHSSAEGNHQLVAFSVADSGAFSEKRVLFDFGPNRRGIDGMAMDTAGNVYATAGQKERAGVYVFSPKGTPLALIRTPGSPTNCAFGKGEFRNVLYVTAGLASPGPDAKFGLYRIRLATEGYLPFQQ